MRITAARPFAAAAAPAFRTSAYGRGEFGRRLARLARRWQRYRAARAAPKLLGLGFGLAIGLAAASALAGLGGLAPAAAGAALGVVSAALAARAVTVPPPLTAALAYDRRLGLCERLSTAVVGARADPAMQALQREDALRTITQVDAARAFPYPVRRRDVLLLGAAAAALGGVLLAAARVSAPVPGAETPIEALTALPPGLAADAAAPTPVDPALQARIEELRAAIAELERQRDPEAASAAVAADAAGAALRRTSEGRRLGRALGNGDFAASAAEARALRAQLADMNSARMDDLAAGMQQASAAAAADAALSGRLAAAAEALARGQLADARAALAQLADEMEAAGATVAAERQTQAQLQQLARQLMDAEAAAEAQPGASGPAGAAAADAPTSLAPPAEARQGTAGDDGDPGSGSGAGGDSDARGRALSGTLETLPAEQRLDAEGRLEIVDIAPTSEGAELVQRPILALGAGQPSESAAAGGRGVAAGRQDVARGVPLDLLPVLDRYFSAP